MMRTLLLRTLYEKRWFVAGWSLVFAVMTTLVLIFYPSFSDAGGGIDQIAKTVPAQLKGLIGDPEQYRTVEGFIAQQIYDIRMPLLIMIMSLVLAIGLTVNDEESGELRSLSSLKISRLRILIDKWIAGNIIVLVLNLVAVAGTYVGVLAVGESIPHELIWRLMLQSTLFGIVAFSIPFSVALATGSRSISLFVGLVVTVGSFLLTTFAKAVEWLQDWEILSLIHYYDTSVIREGRFALVDNWILISIGLITLLVAAVVFRQRDIA